MSAERGVCDGDAGSPLVVDTGNGIELVGLLSFSDPFEMGRPDVFTRLAAFEPWLTEQMGFDWEEV